MSSEFSGPVTKGETPTSIPGSSSTSHNVETHSNNHDVASAPKQTKVSNLTKNLLSSSRLQQVSGSEPGDFQSSLPSNPPSYSASVGSTQNSIPSRSSLLDNSSGDNASFGQNQFYHSNRQSFQYNNHGNDSMNYIPSGHNTPTVVGSSYSSNHSHTPTSFPGTSSSNNFMTQAQFQEQQQQQNQQQGFYSSSATGGSFKPHSVSHAIPTTNLSTDSANSTSAFSQTPSASSLPPGYSQFNQRFSNSFPNNQNFLQQQQQQPQPSHQFLHLQVNRLTSVSDRLTSSSTVSHNSHGNNYSPQMNYQHPNSYVPSEPDHYMTYKEFLHNLSLKDAESNADSSDPNNVYEEHLNIVDFPVNDLITMLACLLTKIIEANDKLHPNHFDNTIAIRQKYKEEKKLRKAEKQRRDEMQGGSRDDAINVDEDKLIEDDDFDENDDDEMKNKYLANVLAFHGTNVPGISLHAYLSRVLKYCPVTNEVFLSLLVYFDRIAKKANNLKSKKRKPENSDENIDEDSNESEQLFVMDSYNIHRLIISGITVSSKFFSDIFYKNLRYAKVGGLPLEELNYLELQFLLLLDFKLMITVEDLQNYGDLLLKFWKREQLTNELVNPQEAQQPPLY